MKQNPFAMRMRRPKINRLVEYGKLSISGLAAGVTVSPEMPLTEITDK
jgi:hypothetical protein